MDWAVFWLTLVSALVAVAAMVFTFVQAKVAVDNRKDAQAAQTAAIAARDDAVKAQIETASASSRIAAVLEHQAAEARAIAEERPDPWSMQPGSYRKTGSAVVLSVGGSHEIADVSFEVERRPYLVQFDPQPVPSTMVPGEAVEVYYARSAADPSMSTLVISWRYADQTHMHTWRASLM